MSEGMWDGGPSTTICPCGNVLNLGDPGPCGCKVRIVTRENLVIDPGPYDPEDKDLEDDHNRMKIGLKFPEGRVVLLNHRGGR